MARTARFIGRSGEKRFSTLCSDAGVTCNPADEDDHGWDHVLEFPHRSTPGVPADLQRSLPPVFVQTKTHELGHGSVRMKLSNSLSLARSPNPCFIVVAPPSGSLDQNSWRALHFWSEQIGQTLKRAREATSKGLSEDSFHRKWITFKFVKADRFAQESLIPWIKGTIREVGSDYAAAKSSLLSSVGFDAERLVGTIHFAPMGSIEELIDHQIGLTPTIPIGGFELRDRRFGIEVKMPIPSGGGWTGTMHAHGKECRLRLRGPDETELELKGEFIVGSLPGLPVDQCKFRVRTDFLDLVTSLSGKTQFNLNFNTADKRSPDDLEKLTRIISWAGGGPIDVQAWLDDQRLFGGTASLNAMLDRPGFEFLHPLIGTLANLSSHLRMTVPSISIEDLAASEGPLVALHDFLTGPDMSVSAQLEPSVDPEEIDEVITYGFADVGGWRFGALTSWRATEQSVDNGVWKFKLGRRRLIERYAFDAADQAGSAAFEADFTRLAATPGALIMDDNAVARLQR